MPGSLIPGTSSELTFPAYSGSGMQMDAAGWLRARVPQRGGVERAQDAEMERVEVNRRGIFERERRIRLATCCKLIPGPRLVVVALYTVSRETQSV